MKRSGYAKQICRWRIKQKGVQGRNQTREIEQLPKRKRRDAERAQWVTERFWEERRYIQNKRRLIVDRVWALHVEFSLIIIIELTDDTSVIAPYCADAIHITSGPACSHPPAGEDHMTGSMSYQGHSTQPQPAIHILRLWRRLHCTVLPQPV